MIFHISHNGEWLASVSDLSMNFSALLSIRKYEAPASSMRLAQRNEKGMKAEKKTSAEYKRYGW